MHKLGESSIVMLSIQLTPEDFANLRFAYSPLLETLISYRVLKRHEDSSYYRRWIGETVGALNGIDLPYLHGLTTLKYQIPDFLTPTPAAPVTDIESEFDRLRATPDDIIRKIIQTTIDTDGDSEILRQFMVYPHEMLDCLIEDLRVYWQHTLAHHWPSMMSVLEGNVLYRARQWALGGTESLVNDLHPGLELHDGQIEYETKPDKPAWLQGSYQLNGDGLQLIPSIFTPELMWQTAPHWRTMLLYQSRGTGLWWKESTPTPDQSLEIVLGEGRARILRTLAMPMNTGEIARRLHITAGAASQHLNRLNQAGLVEPHRSGKRVYYHLTPRGAQLLALFV
ncbi:MAG: winged helix-turn-helix domain-containing protein [Chloroflexota bacterium]